MGMTAPTRVTLCGTLAAELAGRPVHAALPGRKGRLLFARLTVGRDAPVSRDELIDAIWSENLPADPDAAFSTLLTRTRIAVGRDAIRGRGELQLVLGDDAWIDWEAARASVSSAEARLEAGDQRAALDAATAGLEIVRQPFLPDMTTRWIEDCRRELVELHAALLEAAAKASLSMGGEYLATAERLARELIGREPYRESAYALLMNIHSARGNVAEALRVYDGLRQLLRDELGLTPAHAITSLVTQLLAEPEASIPTAAAPLAPPACLQLAARTPLVGRGAELQRLRAVCMEVMEGAARLAVVAGEAGIGKTRLAAELAIDAMGNGFDVIHGRAERHGATPYQPFVEAIRGVLRERPAAVRGVDVSLQPELAELARLVPELRSTVAPAEGGELCQYRIFMAVSALLSALAQERPVALVLDDLQCADAATLLLLRHIVRTAHAEPVLVVATLRTDEPLRDDLRAVLVDLSGDGCLERVALDGLSRAHAAALAPDHDADRLWEQTAGNPFLIEALMRDDDDEGAVPAAIRAAVDGRMLHLSGTGRRVILAAACAGVAFDAAAVAPLSDAPPEAVADALSEAVRVGFLTRVAEPAGGLAFRHPIVRRTLLEAGGQPTGLR
jgi:DNA-binding SARP family transcriptional activator